PEIQYSLPSWFVKRWKKRLPGEWDDFFSANNRVPPLSIRVNTLKITTYELKKILLQEGVGKIEEGRWHDVLKIYGYPYIKDLRSYKMGYFTVQDEGAMWVSHVLSPNPGETVLDLCSSPGGKAFHIATLMSNKGLVYAVDIKDDVLIKETKERLGIDIIKPIRFDLRKEMKDFYQKADKVLLDAPCTGLGTMRRRPELKWKRSEKDIYRMSDLQKLLIKNAVKYVKTGGTLVYSVCTLEGEEGEDVVKYLLTLSPNYELSPIDGKPYLYLYPHIYDTDGFFIAKIKVK
ncbi:MAG TPA: RsmB/NOP family class I SAM-dependent RNA methyltransferase, partial [Candidatus Atribacteria bacterium]|nr:RsmB/NOP family class I SAM-dependent RNA methyltransferase [Candidatus Atribacteria bacterium]